MSILVFWRLRKHLVLSSFTWCLTNSPSLDTRVVHLAIGFDALDLCDQVLHRTKCSRFASGTQLVSFSGCFHRWIEDPSSSVVWTVSC